MNTDQGQQWQCAVQSAFICGLSHMCTSSYPHATPPLACRESPCSTSPASQGKQACTKLSISGKLACTRITKLLLFRARRLGGEGEMCVAEAARCFHDTNHCFVRGLAIRLDDNDRIFFSAAALLPGRAQGFVGGIEKLLVIDEILAACVDGDAQRGRLDFRVTRALRQLQSAGP